jgi:hypothetical protein
MGVPRWTVAHRSATAKRLTLADGSGPPRLATAIRMTHEDGVLQVRFDCDDPDPWSTFERRDDPLWEQEAVEVFLGCGPRTPARYVEFEVSPSGVLFDAVVDNPEGDRATMRVDCAWDCPDLDARAGRRADGWWAELAIPLAPVLEALGASRPPDVWRANLYRIDRPRDGAAEEFSAWSPTGRHPPDFHVPSRFGVVRLVN